jgi:hypothetical protein
VTSADPLAALKRRIAVVVVIDVVCVIAGVVFLYGFLGRNIAWMGAGFAASMVVGFLAQIWLVVSFLRDRPPS